MPFQPFSSLSSVPIPKSSKVQTVHVQSVFHEKTSATSNVVSFYWETTAAKGATSQLSFTQLCYSIWGSICNNICISLPVEEEWITGESPIKGAKSKVLFILVQDQFVPVVERKLWWPFYYYSWISVETREHTVIEISSSWAGDKTHLLCVLYWEVFVRPLSYPIRFRWC